MKKAVISIVIALVAIIALCIAFFVIFIFKNPESQSYIPRFPYKNVKEIKYDSLTVKLKDGYNYDLSNILFSA